MQIFQNGCGLSLLQEKAKIKCCVLNCDKFKKNDLEMKNKPRNREFMNCANMAKKTAK